MSFGLGKLQNHWTGFDVMTNFGKVWIAFKFKLWVEYSKIEIYLLKSQ